MYLYSEEDWQYVFIGDLDLLGCSPGLLSGLRHHCSDDLAHATHLQTNTHRQSDGQTNLYTHKYVRVSPLVILA